MTVLWLLGIPIHMYTYMYMYMYVHMYMYMYMYIHIHIYIEEKSLFAAVPPTERLGKAFDLPFGV